MELAGRVAVATRTGRGLGEAYARRLVADGATVAVTDVDPVAAEAVAAELGPDVAAFALDVTSWNPVRRVAAAIETRLGPVSALFNNAAGDRSAGPARPVTDLGLDGRHLLITGAGGLGRALSSLALDAGMRVTLVDRDPGALDAAGDHPSLRRLVHDIGQIPSLASLLAAAIDGHGPIDGFSPTAAVIRRQHDVAEVTEADWDGQVEVNQKAVYFLTRDVAEHMRVNGRGAIVLVASAAGVTGGVQGTTVYGAAKAAVLGFMHGFARFYAPHQVRINAVVPGAMDTPMLWVGQTEETAAATPSIAGLGRIGQPIEVARPILFLLSDWASYVTGHSLDVDGGWLYR